MNRQLVAMELVAFLSLIITTGFDITEAKFDILWNVPSFLCSHHFHVNLTEDLLKYEILVNSEELFVGDKISIFYENSIGKYPKIANGDIYGGIPRLDKLGEHLNIAEKNICSLIPDQYFSGLGVIDWEAWRPSWEFLWGSLAVYKNRTIELIKDSATGPKVDIESAAKSLWENTAKQWMLQTLRLAKRLRPLGKWCYYLFPDCYNYNGKDYPSEFSCGAAVGSINDRLSWMWEESSALCPSIYLHENELKYNLSQRIWYVHSRLAEAVRVSCPHTKIYPYMNYMMHVSGIFVPEETFSKMVAVVASMGLDGLVIWGSSSYFPTQAKCEELRAYINNAIGPTAVTVSGNVDRCSKVVCNQRGRCTWPKQPYSSWRYLFDNEVKEFDPTNITCRCDIGKGKYCQHL